MDPKLLEELQKEFPEEVATDKQTLQTFSHDASLFEVIPQAVVYPRNEKDVVKLVEFAEKNKSKYPHLSLTGRSAGTDMSGGSINDSILVAFGKYFNKPPVIKGTMASVQPGVFYRDFEKETLKHQLIFSSFPASKEICAMGGIVNNNSGGEKSLQYGKTENYIKRVKVVVSDGSIIEFHKLTKPELQKKLKLKSFEGEIYRKIFRLIEKNYNLIQKEKPKVSKNSAGYNLWNVWDKEKEEFDLTHLWVGAQGTLGLLLEADIELVRVHKHREMMIIFLHDLSHLNQIIQEVLPLGPESFESYDDNTLKLALRFFPAFAKLLGTKGLIQTGIDFLPEFLMLLQGGLPKLVLQVDFTGDDKELLAEKIQMLKTRLLPLHPKTRIAVEGQEEKYWAIRRESFNLLRQKIHNMHTAPFIDDFVIPTDSIGEVLPKITEIIKRHKGFIFTIAGHVGNGNFHIIPLVDIQNPRVRAAIPIISDQVYHLIHEYKGSITGEHNDGLIRTPYLYEMFNKDMLILFKEVKTIFDPQDIFNPRKKVGGTLDYALSHIRTKW